MARTRWEDWYTEVDRAFEGLARRASEVFVMGLSLGACLALRLAEVHGDEVSGLVLVNPSIVADSRLFALAPVMKYVVPSLKGIGSDIKKGGSPELAYDRVPVKAAASLPHLWSLTRGGLGKVTQPVLVYKSSETTWLDRQAWQRCAAACPQTSSRSGPVTTAIMSRRSTMTHRPSSREAWSSYARTPCREGVSGGRAGHGRA